MSHKVPSDSKVTSSTARHFLSTFDLDVHHMPSKRLHVLDYPGGQPAFDRLKRSFELLFDEEHISDVQITPKIEDEPAATLVFLFLSDPKDLSSQVSHLTTYTSSEHPTIWVLVNEKFHPRTKERIASIWEPLTNAQYYEVRPTMKVDNQKWIGTRFTVGRQGTHDTRPDKDVHMALTLSPQAQQRRSSLF